jgi:protein-disulfide isomerase
MSRKLDRQNAARLARERLARQERARKARLWVSAVAAGVLVLAGLIGWYAYASQRQGTYATPTAASGNADGLVLGAGAVTVDVYLDFMCPHCKVLEDSAGDTLDQFVADHKIKLVYHPVAFLDRASTTKYSTRASAAAACAADAGKLGPYVRALYADQPAEGSAGRSDDELIRIAGTVGITEPAFATCVHDGKYLTWTSHVTKLATDGGVNGTPTVKVNGREVEPTKEALMAAVNAGQPAASPAAASPAGASPTGA